MLWPKAVKNRVKTGPDREIVHSYPHRSACPSTVWGEQIEDVALTVSTRITPHLARLVGDDSSLLHLHDQGRAGMSPASRNRRMIHGEHLARDLRRDHGFVHIGIGRTKDGNAVIMRKGDRWTVVPLRLLTGEAVDTIRARAGVGSA
ncbi:hypothetical protein [Streptomyces syringium]|uniref:hypothetical protein n=1 Tax=Streptomyces syringium TaxID=76729 RepID=UPI0033DA7364